MWFEWCGLSLHHSILSINFSSGYTVELHSLIYQIIMKITAFSFRILAFVALVFIAPSFATTHTINFSGTSFSPSTLNVAVGDTIVWSGNFGFHQIQNTAGAIPNGAATFGPSASTDITFMYVVMVPGQYGFQCNFHASMGMIGSFTAVTADVKNTASNKDFSVEQNFPNPFSTSTMINYALNHPSQISLKILDVNGKEIKRFEQFQPAGNYTYQFDGSALTNGTYFYQLQAGESVLAKQMTLLKKD